MKTTLKIMIALTALIYIIPFTVNAQSTIAGNNSNLNTNLPDNKACCKYGKQQQISYEEFINHYGVDDTSLAIINIYFDKRENSAAGRITILPLAAVVTTVNAPIGLALMAITTPIALSGAYTRIKYNRNHLIKALVNYQNDDVMTASLKHKVVNYLETKVDYEQEEMKAIKGVQLAAQ